MKKLNLKSLHLPVMAAVLAFNMLSSCEMDDPNEPGQLVPRTVTEDPSLPSITVNNTMLHSEAFGDPSDPMIVAIHGGPGGDYRSLLKCKEFASDGYYVVFYDQRGCGLSQRHDAGENNFTIEQYINDLDAVINHYKTSENQKIILLGHSWGAMLGTGYANQYPEKVDALVLSEPGGLTWDATMEYISRAWGMAFFGEGPNDLFYQDGLINAKAHETLDYKMMLSNTADEAVGNAYHAPVWRYGSVCNSESIDYAEENGFDFTGNLDQYTTNVFFAYSELNGSYGREWAEKVSSVFPSVKLVMISNSGHDIPWLAWEQYYEEVSKYLNETL